MRQELNRRAANLVEQIAANAQALRIIEQRLENGGRVLDFGVQAEGGLQAGLSLAQVCLSDLGTVQLVSGQVGDLAWPQIQVTTDHPLEACLFSQYAGWRVAVGKFFGMGSGPMRAAGREELFDRFGFRERPAVAVGVLETEQLPTAAVFEELAEKTQVPAQNVCLLAARTSSQAGTVQIVARSVETALHKLLELGFDVRRVRSGFGVAPLPPSGADFLTSLGRTNDAILYGARVHLWVAGELDSLAELGPLVPANSSAAYGEPFREIFESAGGDFYQIDPHLFSPAEITFQSLETGTVLRFGHTAPDVLRQSFGIELSEGE